MISTSRKHGFQGPPAERYTELVALLPPRPLRDRHDYDEAVAMIGRLAGYDLNQDQQDYLEALAVFVERYEAGQGETQIDTRHVGGLAVLRSLMQEHGMSGADLSRLLGVSRSLGPMILRGERRLTVDHARQLGAYFRVDPGVFVR